MSFDWTQYSLAELKAHATQSFRTGGGSRPDVLLIEIDGNQAILKDQGAADPLFAFLIGPILTWREGKALKRLDSVPSVPLLLNKPTSRSLLMAYHESEQITRLDKITPNWPEFFEKLNTAISEVHKAGVAHNDLRNPSNTLISKNGEPILVDLVAAFCQGQKWNFINEWIFKKFCFVDQSAVTKIKSRCAPELLTDDDIQPEQIAGSSGMAIRSLGQGVRKLSRLIFTKR